MKKSIIGAIVGGLIILVWQTLSFTVLRLHKNAEKHVTNQDSILSYLNNNLPGSGNYIMPLPADNATMDEYNKLMADNDGKAQAVVLFHKHFSQSMGKNMLHAFLIDLLMVWMLCWLLLKINAPSFGTIFLSSLFVGLIVFLDSPLTTHVWYLTFGLKGDLIDAVASFGLTGLWLGWWLRRK